MLRFKFYIYFFFFKKHFSSVLCVVLIDTIIQQVSRVHKITIHVNVTKKSSTSDWQEMNPLHFGLFPHVKTNKTPYYKFQAISAHYHLVQKEWHCVTEEEVHEMT